MISREYECCIIGAGPAGLGAALELVTHGVKSILVIDKNKQVGGLARTEKMDNFRFDVGPHRFFTKNKEISRLWHDTLGNDFLPIDRMTRILYKRKYFSYPVRVFDVFKKLGLLESAHIVLSYLATKAGNTGEVESFEDWMLQKFGRKLYETFFKTYTEKVWGIPCQEISAEWAAQRIKGLDILQTMKKAVLNRRGGQIKTLVDRFDYPRLGAGQMYEAMTEIVVGKGATVELDTVVTKFNRKGDRLESIEMIDPQGKQGEVTAKCFFNSASLTHFIRKCHPALDEEVLRAAGSLYHRDHITVNLVVDGDDLFPDQWIYIHSPEVKMARLANYNNFSRDMVNFRPKSALSVEFFAFRHEDLWQMKDKDIIQLAIDELESTGLISRKIVERAGLIRETESYPTYYLGFQEPYKLLKKEIERFRNLYPIGRGGLYKYNNMDHSALSGILAARNYLGHEGSPFDLWSINADAEYHENATR